MQRKVALVARCQKISDGAKVTFIELMLHAPQCPSLRKLAKLRGVYESTVQLHLKELENLKLIRFTCEDYTGRNVVLNYARLAKLAGAGTYENTTDQWVKSTDAGYAETPAEVSTIGVPSSRYGIKDWGVFFRIAGHKHDEKPKVSFGEQCLLKNLARDFGAERIRKAVERFAQRHGVMGCRYNVSTFVEKVELLID